MSIFKLIDLDNILLTHLNVMDDFIDLTLINHYCHKLINNDDYYESWKELYLHNKKRTDTKKSKI